MPKFAYDAMGPDGIEVSDIVEAVDRAAALNIIRSKGLFVTRWRPDVQSLPTVGHQAEKLSQQIEK